MKRFNSLMALILIGVFASGCAHPLTLENIGMYKSCFVSSEYTDSSVGLSAVTNSPEEERLVMAIANDLKKNGFRVTYPFYPNQSNTQNKDFTIKIATSSAYEGSGGNFLVNWPGFLIWAPALFGYRYTAKFNFDVDITDNKNNVSIPRLTFPIDLKIKHADINRTWTEVSWLEFSVIAFIGGIAFTSYDNSVTPLLLDASENKIANYVGSKIASTLVSVKKERKAELH